MRPSPRPSRRHCAVSALLAFAAAAAFAQPHVRAPAPDEQGSARAACTVHSKPGVLTGQVHAALSGGWVFDAPAAPVMTLRSQECLSRAPKQGPPARS